MCLPTRARIGSPATGGEADHLSNRPLKQLCFSGFHAPTCCALLIASQLLLVSVATRGRLAQNARGHSDAGYSDAQHFLTEGVSQHLLVQSLLNSSHDQGKIRQPMSWELRGRTASTFIWLVLTPPSAGVTMLLASLPRRPSLVHDSWRWCE